MPKHMATPTSTRPRVRPSAPGAAGVEPQDREAQVGRSAALMSALVIVSRLTGFFRTWGQAYALGVTVTASCYSVANNLPNQLYEIVVGGMLVTAFLPVYLSVKKRLGREGANAYTSNLVTIVLILMGAVCALGFVFASQVVWTQSFSASSDFDSELAVYFFRFFVIEVVLYALSSILSGVLNAERDYFWSSAAPIFNNFVTTASFLAYAWLVGSDPQLALVLLALGNPLGVAVQVLMQVPSLSRHGIRIRLHLDLHDPAIKETLSIGVPSLVVMLCSFETVSVMTSSSLSATAAGASVSYYARLWYTLPYAILAVPITTAMFTELSDYVARGDMDAYRRGVSAGTSRILFFMVPFTLYLVAFARPLVVLLAAGKFSASDIDMTASYLRALSVSLAPYAVVMYLQKVCSSLRRMGLYASAHVVAAAIQTVICLALTPAFGLNVVAWSSAVYMVAVLAVTFWNLRRTIGGLGIRGMLATALRSLALGLAGAAAGWGVMRGLSATVPSLAAAGGVRGALMLVVAGGIPSLVVTYGLAAALRLPEMSAVNAILGRLLRRRG
ncbi:murein biosynthesis integral membrane protein MurJ [Olsenella sp. DNF00959]|uniref:murein biosynthesis integral membrane protein MurJ n=1 Tax=Olsenella sp. DNF00959 TaxID=1476999 RepID=UPI00079B4938|nr:murein biosynthesis integral membrane protein MurJ [Olsenella sp. DNF00959]KXB63795.1 putative integral membrane protein MviN [Olsenella sp. DNF00959]